MIYYVALSIFFIIILGLYIICCYHSDKHFLRFMDYTSQKKNSGDDCPKYHYASEYIELYHLWRSNHF